MIHIITKFQKQIKIPNLTHQQIFNILNTDPAFPSLNWSVSLQMYYSFYPILVGYIDMSRTKYKAKYYEQTMPHRYSTQ